MNIYTYGVDHITMDALRESGYEVIQQVDWPASELVDNEILFVTSQVASTMDIPSLRERYPDAIILYQSMSKGLRSFFHLHALCEQHDIIFHSPHSTPEIIIDSIKKLFQQERTIANHKLVGFFGSAAGVGNTTVAHTFAKRLAVAKPELKIVFLGLNLYDPGWDQRPETSLDLWKPRITGRILQDSDFERLPVIDGIRILPGNYDPLSVEDYYDEEIEYLLESASDYADIIIADFGAIPQSAAWFVGVQRAAYRYFVAKQAHGYKSAQLLKLIEHLGVSTSELSLIVNHYDTQDAVTARSLSQQLGVPLLAEYPTYERFHDLFLPLGKKEQTQLDDHVRAILVSMGLEQPKRRGRLFV